MRSQWSKLWVVAATISAGCGSADSATNPEKVAGPDTSAVGMTTPAAAAGTVTAPGSSVAPTTNPSGTSAGTAGVPTVKPPTSASVDPSAPVVPVANLPISAECQGINFKDIKYSPGGAALPNKCKEFHATTNNPYAVRCVDAWPQYKTDYPGDEFCILPPPPDKGLQYGFHPQGTGDTDSWMAAMTAGDMSGYKNLGEPWVLKQGDESNTTYVGGTNNPETVNYYRTYIRMRAGSHHMINSIADASIQRNTWDKSAGGGLGAGDNSLPSIQRTDENWPGTEKQPPEDVGLYRIYPAMANIAFNVHHYNGTDKPMLKETWTNIWLEPNATRKVQFTESVPISQVLKLGVGPNTTLDLHYSYSVTKATRVLELFGHRHSWTPNFSAWVVRSGSTTPEVVYQSFDWHEIPTYRYDSITKNATPLAEKRQDGAASGILTINPGDKLHFNCHITFTDKRATDVGNPSSTSIGSLGFANEAVGAEMCILFGWTDEVDFRPPADETGPLPAFATVE